jgi:hypothetical protein
VCPNPYIWQFVHWAISLLCLGVSNFILHCFMYSTLSLSLLFSVGLNSTKNTERGSLLAYCLMLQIFVIVLPSLSISDLVSARLME